MNIGIREAAPPYGFKDANGEYLGFATDIAKAIYAAVNKELGGAIKANYVAVTSQTRIPLLQNGAIDLEAGATVMTIARSKVVDFSIPHFVTSTSALVPAGSSIKEVADLAGKRVGIPQGGLEAALFRTANESGAFASAVKTIGFPDHSQGITALQTGTVDAYSSDEPILYDVGRDRVAIPGRADEDERSDPDLADPAWKLEVQTHRGPDHCSAMRLRRMGKALSTLFRRRRVQDAVVGIRKIPDADEFLAGLSAAAARS